MKLNQYTDDESHHKPVLDMGNRPKGSVVAPMAGLVVKVLLENGALVGEGQPVLVLEAMKMEVLGNVSVTSPILSQVFNLTSYDFLSMLSSLLVLDM